MTARIAVLGANSFSGLAFCQRARLHGHEVIELARPWHDVNENLRAILDIVERERPTHFVNFAALNMVAESWANYADYYQTNVVGMARLNDALVKIGCLEKYLQISTPEVYGSTGTLLAEGAPFNPSTPYAVSRAANDMNLRTLHREYGFPVCFTRTVNVYGEFQALYRIVPRTLLCAMRGRKLKLHGGGRSTRSFIYVADFAEAALRVAIAGRPGEDYHISTGEQTSIRDLVERLCRVAGVRLEDVAEDAEERPGKDMNYQLDSTKIRSELGWQDLTSLEIGLRDTASWYRACEASGTFNGISMEYHHRP